MSSAPLPVHEDRRLALLKELGVLDSSPEDFSQFVAVAAASIANTPMSAISLIDTDRQWFKGSCGLGVQETPRNVSFCAHTILETAPLIVPDATGDARFRDNPFVLDPPFVRFYAGFQLRTQGQAIGALCVIDDRERELSADQIKQLISLAEATSVWLEWRKRS